MLMLELLSASRRQQVGRPGRVEWIIPHLKASSTLSLHVHCILPMEAMTAELQVGPVCLCGF